MKLGKAACALALAGCLVQVGSAFAADKKNRPYDVTVTGYVVKPSGKSMPLGQDLQLREHDVVLKGDLAWFSATHLAAPVTVRALDLDFPIPAGATLRLAAGYQGGDLASLPKEARVFCEEPRHNTVKSLAFAATLGLSSLGARLARDTRTCLVDTDGNATFDKGFIVGTKKADDRHMVDIEPIAYETKMLDPIPGDSRLEVEFLDGGALSGPGFRLNMIVDGEQQPFAALHFFPLNGRFLVRQRHQRVQGLKLSKLPMGVSFGTARIDVSAFDPETKVATAQIVRDFGINGFVVEPLPQYIYIYY